MVTKGTGLMLQTICQRNSYVNSVSHYLQENMKWKFREYYLGSFDGCMF